MVKKKNCEHKSFQLGKGVWICQWCKVEFSKLEVEKMMHERRQGFELESNKS